MCPKYFAELSSSPKAGKSQGLTWIRQLIPLVLEDAQDMFPGYAPSSFLGAKKKAPFDPKQETWKHYPQHTFVLQVICVDFSVGVRYEERGMCVMTADSCNISFSQKRADSKGAL